MISRAMDGPPAGFVEAEAACLQYRCSRSRYLGLSALAGWLLRIEAMSETSPKRSTPPVS